MAEPVVPAAVPISDPVETHVITDDSCQLWTARHAAGAATDPAVREGFVLCHGGPGFWDTLAPIADLLAERGPVIRWDQRGGGRSQHQGPYTLARFIADLDAVRAAHGLDRVTLVGHSWGASLVLQYALAHPDRTRALIYIAGVGLSWDWRPEHNANFIRAMAPNAAKYAALSAVERPTAGQEREADLLRLAVDFPDPKTARPHAERLLSPYFLSDPEVNRALNAELRTLAQSDLIEQCRALAAPALIVDGALDPRPRWSVDSLAAALSNVVRVTLKSAGHLPWLDEPERFAAALNEFLDRSVPKPSWRHAVEDPRETLDALYKRQLDTMNALRRKVDALPDGHPEKARFVRELGRMHAEVQAFRAQNELILGERTLAASEALLHEIDTVLGP